MQRKLLILRSPSLMYNYSGIPPFGLATITAELKSKGMDIEQDDLDAKCAADELFPRHRWGKQFPAKDLMLDIERMRRYWETGNDPDVVEVVEQVLSYGNLEGRDTILLSCIEGDDIAAILALCIGKHLREKHKKTVIVGGEAFPHMMPIKSEVAYFYKNGCFDFYIQGYGEVPLIELFAALDEKEQKSKVRLAVVGTSAREGANSPVVDPLEKVSGLVYPRADGTMIENRPLFDRPEVVPDFEGLPMNLYYKFPDEWGKLPTEDQGVEEILVLPVKLNYCCPMNCAFCVSSGDAFSKVTAMQPDMMCHAIAALRDRWQTPYFFFADDLFNISRKRAVEMAEAFVRHDLKIMWSDCAYGKHLKKDDLKLFRASGACRLVWGLESGSRSMQKKIHKGIDIDELAQILEWSHEAGIYNSLEVVAGLPTETDEDIEETVNLIKALRSRVDQVYLNPFSLITGSLMQKIPEKYGITNVKPVATIFQRNPDQVYSWIQRFTFDEVDGLKWPDKIKQIERSYRRVHETVLELNLGGHDLQTLFQRYTKFGDKSKVADFQTNRRHQAFDYFGRDGQRGHSPLKSVVHGDLSK
jgi:radical SAM superfamily enzyme YgiQ (UPF0313 family)